MALGFSMNSCRSLFFGTSCVGHGHTFTSLEYIGRCTKVSGRAYSTSVRDDPFGGPSIAIAT